MICSRRRGALALKLALFATLPLSTGCGYLAVLGAGYLGSDSQSKGGGGVVVVQTAEGVDLVVGRGPKDLGDTTEGRGEAVVAAQVRLGVTSPATLRTLRVTGQGTGDEGRISSVKLFHDLDGDGALSSGEPQLGTTQTFSGDDGQAVFSEIGFALQSGVSVDLLVVSELPSDAQDGDTFRVEFSDDQALDATTLVNGQDTRIRVFGAPISGGVRTISSTGTLTLSLGAQTPGASGVFPNAQDVEVLQLELRASSVEDIRIDSLRLQASGTLNDLTALGTIELFEDTDNDGVLNRVTDVPLSALSGAPADDGQLVFAGLGRTLGKSSIQRWLLVYQLNGSGLDGQTFRADLGAAADVVGLGLSSNQAPAVQGTPIQGGSSLTVQRARLELSAGPFNPARDATPAQSGVGVLQLRVAASGAEPVVVSSLGISGSGSGDEVTDLAGVRLYLDQDGDGELDAGEALLAGPASYGTNDGTLTLSGFSRELAPGSVELWLVTYDLGAGTVGGDQFTATLAGPTTVAVAGRTSGLVLTATAPAIAGGLLSVRGSLALALGATQPANPNRVLANSSDAPTLQLVVGAGAGENVRLTGLTLTPSGTGNDQLALSGVDLYEDVDLSGTVSGGDLLIQTQTYPGDDLALTFSAAGGLLAGDIAPLTSRTLLVRYRLNGQALEGQTFALSLPTTALTALGVGSTRPIPASGPTLTTSGNPVQAQRARATFALGPENPNASDVLNGTTVPVLQLLASAGPGEGLNLSALTFRSSGTADETLVVQQARLYLEGAGPRGAIDGTDLQLGAGQTFSADDGFVTFSGAPLTSIALSSSATLLLAYDILPNAPAGGNFTARLAAAGDVAGAGALSGLTPEILGTPQTGQAKAIRRGTLAASLGGQNPATGNTFPNRSGVRVLQASLVAGTAETVRVSSFRLTAAGSADESTAVSGISLYLDLNQDGLVSGGDTLLASAPSIANEGNVVLTGFTLDIPPGQTRSLLATCDVSAAALPGTNLRFRLVTPPADLVALGLSSNQAIIPSGAALEGNVLSLVLGALSVSQPASSPGASTELNSRQGVPMLQLRCAANATESARVNTFVITHQGTGVPTAHVSSASLYHDVNGNGVLDADTLVTTTTFAGTTATFTIPPGSFDVAQSSTRDFLVTYDFNGSAPVGATFSARLANNAGLSVLGISSNLALPVTGAPLSGGVKTLEAASLALAVGAGNPVIGNALRNQASLVALQGTLSAGSAEPIRITSLRLSASGSLDLTGEVSRIRLYRENDPPNGVLDGDVLIGDQVGGFTAGAHTFAIGASDLQIPAGGSKAFIVVLDLAAGAGSAGETVSVSLAANGDLVASGVVSGQAVTPAGAPVAGNAQSVVEASLSLALGPNTPAASDVAVVSSGVVVLQARLGAGSAEPVRVTSLRFQVSGAPTSGVTLARLYRDDNNNGALDGDALLGSGTLGGGGDITFTPSAGTLDVAPVGSRDVLLVLDFGNTASEGQAFTSSLPTNGDLVAQGLTSTLAVTPSGAPLTGNVITTREGSLTVAAGTVPPAQNVFNNASGVSALHLALQAGVNDGIRVTALTLRASGTADDSGLQVDLYRDTNGNGTLEGGEPLLQSRTIAANDGTATFGFGPGVLEVAAGQTGFVLARVTLPGTATVGQTHAIRLQAASDLTAQGLATAAAASVAGGFPFQGPDLTAQATSLTLSGPVPQSPSESLFPNASGVRMLRVQLDAGALEAVRVTQLVVRPTGASTGDDTAASVLLYLDQNTNGTVEVGTDTLIQTQPGANASVTFAAGGGLVDVPASGSRQLLVVYTLGAPTPASGDVFQLALAPADLTAQGLGSAAPVTAGGATPTGGLKTIAVGTLSLAAGANNPTASESFAGQTRVMQQLRLSAGVEPVRLDSLLIRHSGTGDPATDLTQVLLYRDLNGNGQVDGDPLLDSATFAGTSATFSQGGGLLSVSPGSPADLLVVYTFGASASDSETFSLLAGAPSDLSAIGTSSGVTLTPSGAGAAGGVQTFRVGALTLATGPAPPLAGSVAVPTSAVAIQQLSLSATGEGARLQTLTIGFSGSGSVAHVQTASLYFDSDGDGVLGPSDTLIQALPMSASTVVFSQGGGLATISTSSVVRLLVTYDLLASASPGETYGADLITAGELSATGEIGGAVIAVSGSAAASNLKTVAASGSLVLSAGSSPPGAGQAFRNQSQVPIQQLRLSASGENARITSLTVTLAGTGASSALTQARLYVDQNTDGAIDAGDVFLGVSSFTGTQASFVAPGGLLVVSAGSPRELLVAYDFNATGGIGNTFGLSAIAATDLVATGVTSGATLSPTGSVAASNFQTLAAGALVIATGPANPGAQNAGTTAVGVAVQQLSLSASGEGVVLDSLAVTRAGAGADAGVSSVRLFRDLNSNGILDGDTLLASGTFTGANVTLGAGNLTTIADGATARFLVVFDFAATGGQTYQADAVAPVDVVSHGATSAASITASGSAALGGLVTITLQPVLTVTQTAIGASSIYPTQSRSVGLRLQINETAGQAARLKQLNLVASGSADESSAVSLVRLFRNLAPLEITVGPEDVLIGVAAFFANDGTAAFGGLNELIAASGSLDLLVAYEVAGASGSSAGETLIASVAVGGLSLEPDGGGAALTPSGLPQTGPVLTIGGQLQLSLGPNGPSGTIGVGISETQAELLQLELSATHHDATVSALSIDASGSGNDMSGIAKAELYRDANQDGVLDGGDPLIQSLTTPFAADNGTAQFTGLSESITAGTSVRWLVSYDTSASGGAGDTYSLAVDSTSDLTSTAAVTTGTLPAQGASLELRGGVTASVGPGAVASALFPNLGPQQVFQLSLATGTLENLTLSSLAVTASGSVLDATWISAAKLYLDDGDDAFEPAGDDTAIGTSQTFSADDGVATFGGLAQVLTAGSTTKIWVSLDLLASPPVVPGKSFQLTLASNALALTGVVSGGAAGVNGVPLAGPIRLISPLGAATTLVAPFDVSAQRVALAAADMNLDGNLDLVGLSAGYSIEVLIGDGAGGFTSHDERTFAGAGVASSIALADFNGDGYPDVAVTTATAAYVVLNDGVGTPGEISSGPITTLPGSPTALKPIQAGDIDRDGDLDLVASDVNRDEFRQYLNDGSGNFSAGILLAATGGLKLRGGLQLVDIDGDERLDYLFSARIGGSRYTAVFPGDGAGSAFAGTARLSGTSPLAVVVGNVNGDAFLDVVTIDEGTEAYFAFDTGSPILSASSSTASTAGVSSFTSPRGAVLADLDGDGADDLVIAHATGGGVVAHISSGSLTFPTSLAIDLPAGAAADVIVEGDFDNDGDVDLVLVSSTVTSQSLYYLPGLSVPTLNPFLAGGARTTWAQTLSGLATGDFNRDGRLDYAVFSEVGERVGVFLQAADGTFTLGFDQAIGAPAKDIAVADVDRDGDLDLVLTRSGASDGLRIFKGDGTGGFGAAVDRATSTLDQGVLALADTNRDGFLDALGASPASTGVQTYRGDGVDFIAGAGGDVTAVAGAPLSVLLADFNHDGILDLATIRPDRALLVYPGLGTYAFGAAVTVNADASLGTIAGVVAGDLDGDGALDLIVLSSTVNLIEVIKGDGAGGFVSQGTRSARPAAEAALVDLDRDGDLDLVIANPSGAVVAIELTTPGTFTFAPPASVNLSSGQAVSGLALGDFDRNGRIDAILSGVSEVELFLR